MQRGKYPFIVGFLALPVLVYVVFMISPFVQTAHYSFTDWGARTTEFDYIGLENYLELAEDEVFRKAFGNSLFFFVSLPLITIALALFFAFMLNVGGRGNRAGVRGVFGSSIYQVIFFFPFILSIAIVAIVWGAIFRTDRHGLANAILMGVGLVDESRPLLFLSDPRAVKWILLGVAVWGFTGFFMVLFSAAMAAIPKDIFEAAVLDGAKRGQQFFRVTLPLLRDTISVAWVYLGILGLDMFALVYALSQGGPNFASEVMATRIYDTAFGGYRPGQFGLACAMGVTLALFTLVLAIIQLRVLRRDRIEY
ncbi:MAG: ABC transporter permease subunit [Micromonosporaceae bacterium]|nr:ABC transporter permease subunit [Micromonosporaceae bacterium]